MKILHGMSEVAGQGINTVKGLRANGHDAVMAVWKRNYMADEPDIDLKINLREFLKIPFFAVKMGVFAFRSLAQYDVMHSHFGHSLVPLNLDVYLYRLFKFKCFSEFHGSEIRFLYNKDVEYRFFKEEKASVVKRFAEKNSISRLLKHVSGIIIHDYELIPHIPDKGKPIYIVPLRVNISEIAPHYPDAVIKKPVIVHSPSKRSTKGTEGILEKLKEVKGDYELILVENKPHEEAMEIYKNADIVIDQISLGTYGVFSIEAMAMGKPVITYISPEIRERFPEELPVISSDFDGLPDAVDRLIADPQLRHDIGVRGREYVERYHDHVKVTKYLYDIYSGAAETKDLFSVL